MDSNEARFILQAYRAGGQDSDNAEFAAALEQVRRDPELARWFEAEQALDTAVGQKLRKVPVPPDLRANILAGRRVLRDITWWRRPRLLAVAALLLLFIGVTAMWFSRSLREPEQQVALAPLKPPFASFHGDMTAFMDKIDHLEFQDKDMANIRQWLQARGAHDDLVLPSRLQGKGCMGCRVVDWQQSKVTLICFYLEPTGKTKRDALHLVVIDRNAIRDTPPPEAPVFESCGKWETASWSDHSHTYILAGLTKGGYLKHYFNP